VMRTEDRYFDLSVYVIPAMQMVTSLGSALTSPPVDMLRPFSRTFLAYSRAACGNRQYRIWAPPKLRRTQLAPSLSSLIPGIV
jgi:hypothetical protein